jgi:two-component system NtrC family sensor kinase
VIETGPHSPGGKPDVAPRAAARSDLRAALAAWSGVPEGGTGGASLGPGGRPLGLRVQILAGLGLVTGFAMLSTGYLALWAAGGSVVSQREVTARAVSGGLAGAVGSVLLPGLPIGAAENHPRLISVLRASEGHGEVVRIEVLGVDEQLVAARPSRFEEKPTDRPDDPAARDRRVALGGVLGGVGPVLHYRRRPGDGQMELEAYAPVLSASRVVGAVRVALDAPPPFSTVLGRSGWVLLALAAGDALLVVGLGFFVLTRLVVRPLQAMQTATARVGNGEWERRIDTDGPREIASLANALNQMTSSLLLQREQLIRTEKLASVGQLAAGVAHEIGNPLAAVLGYAEILRSDAAAQAGAGGPLLSADERRDALDRVKAETQRIHRIIQDLLDYSRPTREEAQATEPLAVLRSAEALLRPQARFRAIKLVSEPPLGSWPLVLVSPGRLRQVFVNLLLNAADAMAGQGTVAVRATVTAGPQEHALVRLLLRDEGPGVSPELERKIFDPFFTTKSPGQGTGLGLSISRSIIESYHGTLELAPTPPGEKGAAFLITLPAS